MDEREYDMTLLAEQQPIFTDPCQASHGMEPGRREDEEIAGAEDRLHCLCSCMTCTFGLSRSELVKDRQGGGVAVDE